MSDTLIIHFEKSNPDFKGVYQAINLQFLAHFGRPNVRVNRDQYLDDEDLRKVMLSYQTVDIIKKYRYVVSL